MFLVLVIALAVLGVGYALWSETLTISGTVQTGEVDVEFFTQSFEECVDVNGVLTCPEPPEKADAANCEVAWSNTATDPNDNGANLLEVTVTGMYPSYHCKVSFDVKSTGNVPVHVWLPEATVDNPEWVATNFENCYEDGVQLHEGEKNRSVHYGYPLHQ
jgi:predicted ribosomally synthesized peptide with SipW-like signal peptide